jgi:flavin-binding protein dodecin
MSESVYKVVEIVGTSKESWEQAATMAMMTAAKTLRDIRVGEVVSTDIHLDGDTVVFRTRIKVSFRYHDER